jgi:hypothetical protein
MTRKSGMLESLEARRLEGIIAERPDGLMPIKPAILSNSTCCSLK